MEQQIEYRINAVLIGYDEFNILHIGFLLDPDNYEDGLTLQFKDNLDEQDILAGDTKYYFGDIDGSGGCYACFERITIKEDNICLRFNDKYQRKIGTKQMILHLKKVDVKKIRSTLISRFEEEDVEIQISK